MIGGSTDLTQVPDDKFSTIQPSIEDGFRTSLSSITAKQISEYTRVKQRILVDHAKPLCPETIREVINQKHKLRDMQQNEIKVANRINLLQKEQDKINKKIEDT